MTRDSDFIGLIEGYLDDFEGHTPLSDASRAEIRARLPSTSQRPAWWPGWRFPHMNTMTRLGLGATAAVAAVALIGFVTLSDGGRVGAVPPESEAPDLTFTSGRHHYSLLFPDDAWTIVERPGSWPEGTVFSERSMGLDLAEAAGDGEPWILLSSQPLDIEPDAWLARYDEVTESRFSHCSVASTDDQTVDGETARVSRYACDEAGDGVEAIMFHADRAYAVRVFHGDDAAYDPRPLLDEFLGMFRFRD